jgi:hypothetical protein
VLLLLSILGCLGLTLFWPVVALLIYHFREAPARTVGKSPSDTPTARTLGILIPAHNESATISATLESLERSIQYLQRTGRADQAPQIEIHVGADSCTDDTAGIARRFPRVTVSEFPDFHSKWLTLKQLCTDSSADWLILVDAGTIWPESLLDQILQAITTSPDALAVCPAYRPLQTGRIHDLLWRIEERLKRIETLSGGPVSVHGATVCYPGDALKRVFQELGSTAWVNDDVVIPLTLRALYPERSILYPVGEVFDEGLRQDKRSLQRRNRILVGNLQWASTLLPLCFRRNRIAGIVALRRLFRVVWAYWALFALVCVFGSLPVLIMGVALVGAAFFVFNTLRDLLSAAMVSLWTPFQLLMRSRSAQGAWK